MHNCDYCGSEIKRHVFCKPSHQVMFSRKGKLTKIGIIDPKGKAKLLSEKELDQMHIPLYGIDKPMKPFVPMPKMCPKHKVLTLGHGVHH